MEYYYLAMKRNDATTWMTLENIILSKRDLSQKQYIYDPICTKCLT